MSACCRRPALEWAQALWLPHAYARVCTCVYVCALPRPAGELKDALPHSMKHRETVPTICAFSVLGYVTVSLILLVIKHFGATNAEIVKSMRKVCQVSCGSSSRPSSRHSDDGRFALEASGSMQFTVPCILHPCWRKPSGHATAVRAVHVTAPARVPCRIAGWIYMCLTTRGSAACVQVILSFIVFPKPLSWKYCVGGALVAASLYYMQRMGKRPIGDAGPAGKGKGAAASRERERDGGGGAGES